MSASERPVADKDALRERAKAWLAISRNPYSDVGYLISLAQEVVRDLLEALAAREEPSEPTAALRQRIAAFEQAVFVVGQEYAREGPTRAQTERLEAARLALEVACGDGLGVAPPPSPAPFAGPPCEKCRAPTCSCPRHLLPDHEAIHADDGTPADEACRRER